MKIVLLAGKAGSGKDTLAHYLQCFSTNPNYSIAFADPLKDIAHFSFGWDFNKDEKGRKLLQTLGEGGRQYDPLIWVNRAKDTIRGCYNLYSDVTIFVTDVRYLNEITGLKEFEEIGAKVYVFRVERPSNLEGEAAEHISETQLDNYKDWDMVIDNSGDVLDLMKTALNIAKDLEL